MAKSWKALYEEQSERWKQYPPNRICFYGSEASANNDMENFKLFRDGQIDMEQLRRRTARGNFLPLEAVTEENLMYEMKVTGWTKKSETNSEDLSQKHRKRGRPKSNA